MNKIIEKIKEDSFLINEENKKLMSDDLINLGVNKDSLFYELYTTYFSFAVGNGTELFSLEQIMDLNKKDDSYIVFGSDDGGTFVYIKAYDKVLEIDGIMFSKDTIEDLNKPVNEWKSFEDFLKYYYEEYLEN